MSVDDPSTGVQRRWISRLELGERGSWLVETETADYHLDLDRGLVTRKPLDVLRRQADELLVRVAALRRDGRTLRLLSVEQCTLGLPMCLLLDLRQDDIVTARRTTLVVAIHRLG